MIPTGFDPPNRNAQVWRRRVNASLIGPTRPTIQYRPTGGGVMRSDLPSCLVEERCMTEQEELFIHFSSCVTWLNNSWRLLQLIRSQSENPLVGPAFRFALVEYCKPYKISMGKIRRLKLDTRFVPCALLPLHEQIVTSRDQVQA